jgi:hypothetical protein
MRVSEILDARYQLLSASETKENCANGIYAGDLLSIVMKSAKPKNLLITVITNINTIAVAVLMDFPIIIFAEGNKPTKEMIAKADDEKIALLGTELKTYEVILDFYKRGLLS